MLKNENQIYFIFHKKEWILVLINIVTTIQSLRLFNFEMGFV